MLKIAAGKKRQIFRVVQKIKVVKHKDLGEFSGDAPAVGREKNVGFMQAQQGRNFPVKAQISQKGMPAWKQGRNPFHIVGEIPARVGLSVVDKQKRMFRVVSGDSNQGFIGKASDAFQAIKQKQLSIYGYFHLPLDLKQRYRIEPEYGRNIPHRKRKSLSQRIVFNGATKQN